MPKPYRSSALLSVVDDLSIVLNHLHKYPELNKTHVAIFQCVLDCHNQSQNFIIENDWASAFKNAEQFEGDNVRLPYEVCAFEYSIKGKRSVAIAFDDDGSFLNHPLIMFQFVSRVGKYGKWQTAFAHSYDEALEHYDIETRNLVSAAYEQIKAASIAIEAEAAICERITSPEKLNKSRAKRGKTPLRDYHIIRLNPARARSDVVQSDRSHRSPRLHFRRGHWRHLPATEGRDPIRTWVKWCLVGNPDLGFIDKEYRL